MAESKSEPLVLAARDAARGFSDALSQVQYTGRRVVVTRQGRAVAALVSIADLERLGATLPPGTRRSD
jgi:prevent-host-death family protein